MLDTKNTFPLFLLLLHWAHVAAFAETQSSKSNTGSKLLTHDLTHVFALAPLKKESKTPHNKNSDFKTPYAHFLNGIQCNIALQQQIYFQCSSLWKYFTACSVLAIEGGLTVYGVEGMDGCPGPTAAWRWGTDSPSLWGTLLLLCPTH